MPELSGEFWAAIAGAIVGGAISALLQLINTRAAGRERQRADRETNLSLARTLLFKVIKIESDFLKFRNHIESCEARAKSDELEFGGATFLPLANFPRPIFFTPQEMGAALHLGDEDLFNDLITMDEVHSGIIEAHQLYRQLRTDFSDKLAAAMQGEQATAELSDEEFPFVAPRTAQLDELARDIASMVRAETNEPLSLSRRLTAAINKAFSLNMRIEQLSEPKSGTA